MSYQPTDDSNLRYAFEYNWCDIEFEDITEVLACYEGENDGESWKWVVKVKSGELWALVGSCDYTGWDCQSGLSSSKILVQHNLREYFGKDSGDLEDQLGSSETMLPWKMQAEQEWAREYDVVDLTEDLSIYAVLTWLLKQAVNQRMGQVTLVPATTNRIQFAFSPKRDTYKEIEDSQKVFKSKYKEQFKCLF